MKHHAIDGFHSSTDRATGQARMENECSQIATVDCLQDKSLTVFEWPKAQT